MNFDSSAFVSDSDLLQELLEYALPLDCSKGRILFRQGDSPYGVFILRRGKVSMSLGNNRGATLISTELAPGAIFGLPALMSDKPYTMSAVAKKGAMVSYVTRKHFSALMLSRPRLAFDVLRVLAEEVHATRTAIAKCPFPVPHDSAERSKQPEPEFAHPA